MDKRNTSIRIDAELLARFRIIARHEGRSVNRQIVHLIRQCVREFEAKHGKIEFQP